MTAFLRIAAMLKVKGVLYLRDVIFSFPPADYEESINDWIRQVTKPEGQGWTVRDFEMHVREEHSTYGWIRGLGGEPKGYSAPLNKNVICKRCDRPA